MPGVDKLQPMGSYPSWHRERKLGPRVVLTGSQDATRTRGCLASPFLLPSARRGSATSSFCWATLLRIWAWSQKGRAWLTLTSAALAMTLLLSAPVPLTSSRPRPPQPAPTLPGRFQGLSRGWVGSGATVSFLPSSGLSLKVQRQY